MGAASSSPTLASAYTQFVSMVCTHYQHAETEDVGMGFYYYDCVGFTGYTVRTTTPNAWASLQQGTGIRSGYVPTPGQFVTFFGDLVTANPSSLPAGWQSVATGAAILPGDVLAWNPEANNTAEAGHSVMALSAPNPKGGGRYELIVMDSTATTHGRDDTRQTSNPLSARNAPLGSSGDDGAPDPAPATAPSGLGIGTIALVTDSSGTVTGIEWTVGTAVEQVTFGAGRPVS
jgi:hypothetical protein